MHYYFSATRLLVLSQSSPDTVMDLASMSFNSSLPAQWPNRGSLLRGVPFGGALGSCMIVCEGQSSPNVCYM